MISLGKDDHYSCSSCGKYKLCEDCRFCPNGHALTKTVMISNLNAGYSQNKFICDNCGCSASAKDYGVWFCGACDYGVCQKCLN